MLANYRALITTMPRQRSNSPSNLAQKGKRTDIPFHPAKNPTHHLMANHLVPKNQFGVHEPIQVPPSFAVDSSPFTPPT